MYVQVLIAYRQQAVTETLINTYEKFILKKSNISKTNKALIDNKISPQSSDKLYINNHNNLLKTQNKNKPIEIEKNKSIVNMFKKIFKNKNLPQKPATLIEDINNSIRNTEIMVEKDRDSSIGMTCDNNDLNGNMVHEDEKDDLSMDFIRRELLTGLGQLQIDVCKHSCIHIYMYVCLYV
jgi:hypothetical protein